MIKDRKNALMMSAIFVIVSATVSYLARKLYYLYYFGNRTVDQAGEGISLFSLEAHGGWLFALLIIVGSIFVISLWVWTLDDTYFGPRAAFRWAAMGVVYAVIDFVVALILNAYKVFVIVDVAGNFVPFMLFALSYGIVFRVSWRQRRVVSTQS